MNQNRTRDKRRLAQEVEARFGLMPNFFCTAAAAPGLIDELWAFAKSAYLDSPLPSLFKERLFVYLSRFCAVRYCIVRHVGFLIGEGRPAGDTTAVPETIEQVIELLTRPARCPRALEQALARLEALIGLAGIPAPRTELESDLFDALTIIFLEPRLSERARNAVRRAFGEQAFETLAAYLAFIRTAHYWTETHPELSIMWFQSLRRRSQRHRLTWERIKKLANDFFPLPKILHPWPDVRFAVTTQGGSRMP